VQLVSRSYRARGTHLVLWVAKDGLIGR